MGFGESEMTDSLSLSFAADEMALRAALGQVREYLANSGFPECFLGSVELVLAEAVNNVIEHAYADRPEGQIDLHLEKRDAVVVITIEDEGVQMPGGRAPEGRQHDLDVEVEDLPEGGFGWFLIRSLTDRLDFSRIGSRNRLCIHMRADRAVS